MQTPNEKKLKKLFLSKRKASLSTKAQNKKGKTSPAPPALPVSPCPIVSKQKKKGKRSLALSPSSPLSVTSSLLDTMQNKKGKRALAATVSPSLLHSYQAYHQSSPPALCSIRPAAPPPLRTFQSPQVFISHRLPVCDTTPSTSTSLITIHQSSPSPQNHRVEENYIDLVTDDDGIDIEAVENIFCKNLEDLFQLQETKKLLVSLEKAANSSTSSPHPSFLNNETDEHHQLQSEMEEQNHLQSEMEEQQQLQSEMEEQQQLHRETDEQQQQQLHRETDEQQQLHRESAQKNSKQESTSPPVLSSIINKTDDQHLQSETPQKKRKKELSSAVVFSSNDINETEEQRQETTSDLTLSSTMISEKYWEYWRSELQIKEKMAKYHSLINFYQRKLSALKSVLRGTNILKNELI